MKNTNNLSIDELNLFDQYYKRPSQARGYCCGVLWCFIKGMNATCYKCGTELKDDNEQGEVMSIDVFVKSSELLESLANSLLDRNANLPVPFFSLTEVHLVENWIKNLIDEIKKPVDI
jgi:hypothetical protein